MSAAGLRDLQRDVGAGTRIHHSGRGFATARVLDPAADTYDMSGSGNGPPTVRSPAAGDARSRAAYSTPYITIAFGGIAAICLVAGVSVIAARHSRLAITVTLLVLATWSVRLALARLVADERGVRVRGALRTVNIPWGEISQFSIGRWWFLGCVLLVHRSDGRRLPVVGVEGITGQPSSSMSKRAQAVADELNARLGRAGNRASTP
jgi:hypothetical protein